MLLVKILLMMMLMISQLYCVRDDINIKLLALEEMDNHITELMIYLKTYTLPIKEQQARMIVDQASLI